jgi:hypothetical protein
MAKYTKRDEADGQFEPSEVSLVIPTGSAAEQALRDIGEANARTQRAHTRYVQAQETAKERRDIWQNLAEQLQVLIQTRTQGPSLPLFDAGQAEEDRIAMLAGGLLSEGEPEAVVEVTQAAQEPSVQPIAPAAAQSGGPVAIASPAVPESPLDDEELVF